MDQEGKRRKRKRRITASIEECKGKDDTDELRVVGRIGREETGAKKEEK